MHIQCGRPDTWCICIYISIYIYIYIYIHIHIRAFRVRRCPCLVTCTCQNQYLASLGYDNATVCRDSYVYDAWVYTRVRAVQSAGFRGISASPLQRVAQTMRARPKLFPSRNDGRVTPRLLDIFESSETANPSVTITCCHKVRLDSEVQNSFRHSSTMLLKFFTVRFLDCFCLVAANRNAQNY